MKQMKQKSSLNLTAVRNKMMTTQILTVIVMCPLVLEILRKSTMGSFLFQIKYKPKEQSLNLKCLLEREREREREYFIYFYQEAEFVPFCLNHTKDLIYLHNYDSAFFIVEEHSYS